MIPKPEEAGMSAERLERITTHLETRYLDPGKIAGCQVLVARHGHVAYWRSLGRMDLERDLPLRDDTIFRIYSMTKPITSVALMQLYEDGHFQLGDPASRFIPEWEGLEVYDSGEGDAIRTVPCERPMSIRDLLMHMSGLPGRDPQHPLDRAFHKLRAGRDDLNIRGGAEGATLQTLIDDVSHSALKFQPGRHWNYGLSTDVCGYLVEKMSGLRFDRYLQERIFDPLGMTDTGFSLPPDQVDRFAANYGRLSNKTLKLLDDPHKSRYLKPQTYFSGAGGLVSTTADYYRFCQMLLNGGELDGARIIGSRTIRAMARNHLPGGGDLESVATGGYGETAFEGVGFGLGFAMTLGEVETQSVGSNGDYYWGGAASTIFWIDPVEDLCVIFMTQLMPSGTFNFRGQLKNLVVSSIVD